MKSEFLRRFKPGWFVELLTLPGDLVAGFFLVGGPSLEKIRWWWFAYLGAVYAAIFLAGKLMASYREEQACGDKRVRGLFGAALHGLGVIAGASFIPASIRVEGVPFALHPTVVYLGALAVFLYAAAACVALGRGESGEGRDPGKVHALPFLAVVVGLAPAVLAWIPMDGTTKPSSFMPLALFAFALAGLHAMMLWRVYPRYADKAGLETRHLRNLMRVQAALVVATVSKGEGAMPALVAGLGIYVLSSVFNYLRKPLEGGIPVSASEDEAGGESA